MATKVEFSNGVEDFHLARYIEVRGLEDAPHEPSAPLATYIIHDTGFRKAIRVIVQGMAYRIVHVHLSRRQHNQFQDRQIQSHNAESVNDVILWSNEISSIM